MKKLAILAALAAFSGAYAQQTFDFTTDTIGAVDAFNDPDNQFRSATSGSSYNAGTFTINSATLTEIATSTFASEARIRVRNSGYTGATEFLDITPINFGGYTGSINLASPFTVSGGFFRNRPIASGSTWSFEFADVFNDGVAGAVEQNFTNLSFTANAFAVNPPPTGTGITINDTSSVYATPDLSTGVSIAGGPAFFSFTLDQSLSATDFLDFDVSAGTLGADSEIGLYNSAGVLVATDDDDSTGLFSQLSFGAAGTNQLTGATGAAGRDGTLAAGTYYLAVGSFDTVFGADNFEVTGSANAANYTLNVRTNVVANPVPEPATMAALGLGALALIRRRRASK